MVMLRESMPRQVSRTPERIYQALIDNPGQRAAELARTLRLNKKTIAYWLPRLEHTEYAICEDDSRHLYPAPKRVMN